MAPASVDAIRSGSLRVTRTLAIPLAELTWLSSTSGGPGGQHANRSATRVEVRFDVVASASLGPRQRSRLLERLGPVVRAASHDERSQARNRAIALERLRDRLAAALRIEKERRPTRPPLQARERRLGDKHRRASVKRERSYRPDED